MEGTCACMKKQERKKYTCVCMYGQECAAEERSSRGEEMGNSGHGYQRGTTCLLYAKNRGNVWVESVGASRRQRGRKVCMCV